MTISAAELTEQLDAGRVWDVWSAARALPYSATADRRIFELGAVAATRIGRHLDAAAFLTCAVALAPENGQAWRGLGEAWFQARQFSAAEYAWSQAEALASMNPISERHRQAVALALGRQVLDKTARVAQIRATGLVFPEGIEAFVPDKERRIPVLFTLGEGRLMQAALTIDDGPSPDVTPIILETLARLEVKAVFFVVGQSVEKYPDLVDRMLAEGHDVLSHSWSHRPFTTLSDSEIAEELELAERALSRHRPTPSPYPFRLPGGMGWPVPRVHAAVRAWREDAVVVHWNVDTSDCYAPLNFAADEDIRLDARLRALEVVLDPGFASAIILMHDKMDGSPRGDPRFFRYMAEEMVHQVRELGMEIVLPDWRELAAARS